MIRLAHGDLAATAGSAAPADQERS
jgi:hypothetical protein